MTYQVVWAILVIPAEDRTMTATFHPQGRFNQTQQCICVTMYAEGVWLDGHDECSGEVQLGPRVPELNLANDNARHLFALLGVDGGDLMGSIPATDLLALVSQARQKPMAEYTRTPGIVDGVIPGVRAFSGGLDADRLQSYIDQLAAIANWCIDEGVDQVGWD